MVTSDKIEVGTKLIIRKIGTYTSSMKVGDVVTVFNKNGDAWSDCKLEDGRECTIFTEGCSADQNYKEFDLYEEKPSMEVTRENLSDKKVYVTLKANWFRAGTAVVLFQDDGSSSPKFKKLNSDEEAYISLENLKEFGAEPEVKELTLLQVAQKFGVDVAQVRIKE